MPVRSTGSTRVCSKRWTRRCRAELLVEQGSGDGVAGEVPDHGAQLEGCQEAQPVVDAPDPPVVAAQHVAALAVRVVGDVIEQGDPPQLAVGLGGILEQGEVMLLEVAVDEPLQRPDAQGSVLADHGRRTKLQPSDSLRS